MVAVAQVIVDISVSLDGFIAQRDDTSGPIHDWYFDGDVANQTNPFFQTSPESAPVVADNLASAGAVLAGRRTYDLTHGWDGDHPLGEVACFVVTHEPPGDVPDGATTFTFVTTGIDDAIEQAKQAAGEEIVYIMGGASVVWQALAAGLVDEFHLHLAHVFIGDGVRLFDDIGDPGGTWPIGVSLIRQVDAPGVTHLFFGVDRSAT